MMQDQDSAAPREAPPASDAALAPDDNSPERFLSRFDRVPSGSDPGQVYNHFITTISRIKQLEDQAGRVSAPFLIESALRDAAEIRTQASQIRRTGLQRDRQGRRRGGRTATRPGPGIGRRERRADPRHGRRGPASRPIRCSLRPGPRLIRSASRPRPRSSRLNRSSSNLSLASCSVSAIAARPSPPPKRPPALLRPGPHQFPNRPALTSHPLASRALPPPPIRQPTHRPHPSAPRPSRPPPHPPRRRRPSG